MKNEISEYIDTVQERLRDSKSIDERFVSEMLIRIKFYQHERLVHLIVTMTFAIMTVISFYMMITAGGIASVLLSVLFLCLVIPYIYHYYFLENSTQKLYTMYYRASDILYENKNASDRHGL